MPGAAAAPGGRLQSMPIPKPARCFMRTYVLPLTVALLSGACASIHSVALPTIDNSQAAGNLVRYQCDNGHRLTVNYKNSDEIDISFHDGKGIVVGNARNAPAASGAYYVSDANNLRWHEKGGSGILNYPASDGRMLETRCSTR
ncbi:hypothetical protein CO611_08040 [Lysobacteraceae bacterium NML03-0222]|nr:hypothetical protein CO611_08040 [Xanthomonadaceae bacterium NML03-0222]